MGFKLYEISAAIQALADMMEDGVEGLEESLAGAEGTFTEKAESIIRLARSKEAEAAALDAEIIRLQARKSKLNKDAVWLMNYIERGMKDIGMDEIKSLLFDIKLRKTPDRVEIVDRALLPREYLRFPNPPAPEPDKAAIKESLKKGMLVPGALLAHDLKLNVK